MFKLKPDEKPHPVGKKMYSFQPSLNRGSTASQTIPQSKSGKLPCV